MSLLSSLTEEKIWAGLGNCLAALIPVRAWRQKARFFLSKYFRGLVYQKRIKEYKEIVAIIKKRVEHGEKIRVVFLVVFDCVFPSANVFEELMKHDDFETAVYVIPDTSRGEEHMASVFDKTFFSLKQKYGDRIYPGWDSVNNEFIDIIKDSDIVFFSNPYDHMVHKLHGLQSCNRKKVLPIYIPYAIPVTKFSAEQLKVNFSNCVWKNFVDTQLSLNEYSMSQTIKGENVVVTGYPKLDKLNCYGKKSILSRRRILICPHHTVVRVGSLKLSNFIRFSDFFLSLFKKYSDIDFIFRPHPLLWYNLVAAQVWSQNQVDCYLEKVFSFANVKYDDSSDYIEEFALSDAIIHDCGSFTAEYLYTGKPCCFMLNSWDVLERGFSQNGCIYLNNYYKAFSQDDITQFIDETVIKGIDPLKSSREHFFRTVLEENFSIASSNIKNYLQQELGRVSPQ